MNGKLGLSAALAAIMLAAGIESAAAIEAPNAGFEQDLQRIEATASVADLQLMLEQLRATDPNHPLIAILMARIIDLSRPSPSPVQKSLLDSDTLRPY